MVVYHRGKCRWPEQVDTTHLPCLSPRSRNIVNRQGSNHRFPRTLHLLRPLTVLIEVAGLTENRRGIIGEAEGRR